VIAAVLMDRRVLTAATVATVALALVGCGYPDYVYAEADAIAFDDTANPDDGGGGESGTEGGTEDVCVPNECGGCKTLGVKGDKCGSCGHFDCEGTEVKCVESTPVPGTTCGVCHTSKYTCTALGESMCAADDDRTIYEDVKFESTDTVVFTLDHTTEVIATYAAGSRPITLHDAAFLLRRIDYVCPHVTALPNPDPACTECAAATGGGFDCKVPAASALTSELTVTLYTGSPDKTLTAIASGKLADASKIPTAPGFQTATFVMEAPPVAVGTQLSVGINTTSTRYAFRISGGGSSAFPAAPAKMSWFHRKVLPSPGAFVEEPTTDTALVVHGKACPP
jgi:hypothetical protein